MRIPTINGLIKRRILANFRADPEITQKVLPNVFRPKLHDGNAIVGICLIRLENIRPKGFPGFMGIASENAAHRIAVLWTDEKGHEKEGVYIARRDTSSLFNHMTGGRFFPGEHSRARFEVAFDRRVLDFKMQSVDGLSRISIKGNRTDSFSKDSCFRNLNDASDFFKGGSTGYSVTQDPCRLDGIVLATMKWEVTTLEVSEIHSSYYSDEKRFPSGSIQFDNALLMENIEHEWHGAADMAITQPRHS